LLKIPNPFFILELANNHMGDMSHAKDIINQYSEICNKYPYTFALKFQFRNLETFLHPDSYNDRDNKLVKRFNETKLSDDNFLSLNDYAKKSGFKTMATPFDETSVDLIKKIDIDFIKIASCSFTDWPLLEKVVLLKKPIIASSAGSSLEEISQVVSFFKHRKKEFALMYCVGEYPTPDENMLMCKIDTLRSIFKDVRIGFSTHESPTNINNIKIAISKGATIFEKHIGVTNLKYKNNLYSSNPDQYDLWLNSALQTYKAIGSSDTYVSDNEIEKKSLNSLKRGIFANRNIKKGEVINEDSFFLAFPSIDKSITASDCSKYVKLIAEKNISLNQAITSENCSLSSERDKILEIVKRTNTLLNKHSILLHGSIDLEISHHYGFENFFKFGLIILTLVNRKYCKKLLLSFKGQKHPEQYHKVKEETFNVLHGEIELTIDKVMKKLSAGDVITIKPGQIHSWVCNSDSIIEELSTTHKVNDSFYLDKNMSNKRKTFISHWMNSLEH
jgi:sialic acid synthase SpsE/mannose-6-phosphate isomerase-like protein (cupin superfamily)